jgi:hypothetical protein
LPFKCNLQRYIKGGAYVHQSGEASMEFSTGLNNALGFAEKLDIEIIKVGLCRLNQVDP